LLLRLADALNQVHPGSPSALTLQGFAKLEDNIEGAIGDFVCALEIDENFWLAAWWCGLAYQQENNWQAARNYYCRALRSEVAQQMPDIHFYRAWCSGKLKDLQGEEKYYRACLELDPDYPYARNNLGWSLNKQGKYEEAVKVFEEAIKRGNDGKYPLRNKVGALVKLGRFREAIETLQQDTSKKGELTKSTRKEIARVEKLIAKQGKGQIPPEQDIEIEKGLGEAPPSKHPLKSKQRNKPHDDTSFGKERWLEMMLEEMIQQNNEAFRQKLGRKLRMYVHPEKGYGRQFPIPKDGRIDLLVEDIDTNDLIVIELKRGQSDDQVVGQISRYMTWVRENLAERDQRTCGIICVHHASENLKLSAKNIPGLEIFEYELNLGIV
jgi:tetratricopeptide (TPR) repeat protein